MTPQEFLMHYTWPLLLNIGCGLLLTLSVFMLWDICHDFIVGHQKRKWDAEFDKMKWEKQKKKEERNG